MGLYADISRNGFLLTRPLRGATRSKSRYKRHEKFLLTRPLRGATRKERWRRTTRCSFLLTRPLRGATVVAPVPPFAIGHFYSHAPCGARHGHHVMALALRSDFYSHAPCGARRPSVGAGSAVHSISTHTPLAGRDDCVW